MDTFTGKYYIQNGEKQDATILFLKDRLSIGIRNEEGNPRVVYWPYAQIIRQHFRKRNCSVVRYGSYPIQTIEVDSTDFADKLEAVFLQQEKSWAGRMFNKNGWRMTGMLAGFIAILLLAYFWLIPWLAERMAVNVPVTYEEKLGNELFDVLQRGFVVDEEKTRYINDFFRELKIPGKYNTEITVVKEDIANAFALPGGKIVVYDRLLAGIDHYDELAALLAHEFTHISEKHTTRSLFRRMASSIFLSILLGDAGSVAGILVRHADNLKGLSYSRKLEKEADLNGLKILSERKIDCNGFVRLFEFLKKEYSIENLQPAEWVSSHPDLENRITYIRNSRLFNAQGVQQNETLQTIFFKLKTGD